MPLHTSLNFAKTRLVVWRLDEPISFFETEVKLGDEERSEFENISFPGRKKQWLAARYALQQILPGVTTIKDEHNKPHPLDHDGHISLTHSVDHVAAIYNPEEAVGIDLEPFHPKVKRVATKFLSKEERAHIDIGGDFRYLTLAWSIKEAVYKWYGLKSLSFKRDIILASIPTDLESGRVSVKLNGHSSSYVIEVTFKSLGDCILVYTS